MFGTNNPKNLTEIADGEGNSEVPAMDTASIIGLVVWFCCVLYSSIRCDNQVIIIKSFGFHLSNNPDQQQMTPLPASR